MGDQVTRGTEVGNGFYGINVASDPGLGPWIRTDFDKILAGVNVYRIYLMTSTKSTIVLTEEMPGFGKDAWYT